jgi:hypothetical protein
LRFSRDLARFFAHRTSAAAVDQTSFASPTFILRLNFATADCELRDILDWGDGVQCGDHLLIALKLSHLRVALALIDSDWKVSAVLRIPILLKKVHPGDSLGAVRSARLRVLKKDGDSWSGLLCVEQAWHRVYPLDLEEPKGHRTGLASSNLSWYRFKINFFAGIPVFQYALERTEFERGDIPFRHGAERDYWFSSKTVLPPPGPSPAHSSHSLLEIAEAEATGLPGGWRPVGGLDWTDRQGIPSDYRKRASMRGVRPYDHAHALCLISCNGTFHLVPVRLSDGTALAPQKVPLRSGWSRRLAWSTSSNGGGTIWLFVSNEKSSAAKRDRCLWRIDYSANLLAARRASDAIRVTRLSEDRVMTETAVLDYDDVVISLWKNGLNITKPNTMRCCIYRRGDGTNGKSDVPTWTCEAADEFLDSLPITNGRDVTWMGKSLRTPESRKFPDQVFRFGNRFGAAFLHHPYNSYRTELVIGEFLME